MENFKNSSNASSPVIGGIAYFIVYMSDYLPYVVLYLLGTVLGVIGNVIIMATILVNRELHSATYMLIFNLSIADLIISGFVDPFSVVGVFQGEIFFNKRPGLCEFVAAACLVACITSLMNIGFLSFNRYIHICHSSVYSKFFSTKCTLVYCALTWFIGFLITVPNFTKWGGLEYDHKTLSCLWDRLASHSYSIFFPLSSIVLPCIAIAICYIRIFLYSYRSSAKTAASASSQRKKQSLRVAQGLFASFMLFTLCWLPYGLVVMIDYQDKFPRSAVMFTMAIAHLNSSLNPILYGVFNTSFRNGYVLLFKKILCIEVQSSNISTLSISIK